MSRVRYSSFEDRLSQKITVNENGCWLWLSQPGAGRYAKMRIGSRSDNTRRVVAVHRFMYEQHYGVQIPKGMCVCHKCDTPRCVNPQHLFLGTIKDNTQDMMAKGRWGGPTKLTWEQAREIRKIAAENHITHKDLGVKYGVSPAAISAILHGRSWKE